MYLYFHHGQCIQSHAVPRSKSMSGHRQLDVLKHEAIRRCCINMNFHGTMQSPVSLNIGYARQIVVPDPTADGSWWWDNRPRMQDPTVMAEEQRRVILGDAKEKDLSLAVMKLANGWGDSCIRELVTEGLIAEGQACQIARV